VYMHIKEYARGSNTGALPTCAFPDYASVFIAGVPEQEEAFSKALEVLFMCISLPAQGKQRIPPALSYPSCQFASGLRRECICALPYGG
jgi:hypothetical protein